MHTRLVWDLPLRLFHWLFAASFTGAWLTAESDTWLSLHTFLGYLMLALIGFRLIWGVTGSHYARFSSFLYAPRAGLAYLKQTIKGTAVRHLGHNPAGSQAVFLLLGLGLLTGVSGLFVQGGEEQHGVAAGLISPVLGTIIKISHEILAQIMLLVVAGHLAGVALESWRHHENLSRAMITGKKATTPTAPAARPHYFTGLLLVLAVMLFAGWWFQSPDHASNIALIKKPLPENALWQEECGSCHQAFHPSLLPARSWQAIITQHDRHFGDDLGLDTQTARALLAYAIPNAAEHGVTEAARKINRSIPPKDAPLRITLTPYWIKKHRAIPADLWRTAPVNSRSHCAACHRDAHTHRFEDEAIHTPVR